MISDIFTYLDILVDNPQSAFQIISLLAYDPAKLVSMDEKYRTYVYNNYVSFPIIKSQVEFKSLRFEGNFSPIFLSFIRKYLDDIINTSHDEVYFLRAIYLDDRKLSLNNIDINVYGVIFKAEQPLQFDATNLTVVDYHHNKAGFEFIIT